MVGDAGVDHAVKIRHCRIEQKTSSQTLMYVTKIPRLRSKGMSSRIAGIIILIRSGGIGRWDYILKFTNTGGTNRQSCEKHGSQRFENLSWDLYTPEQKGVKSTVQRDLWEERRTLWWTFHSGANLWGTIFNPSSMDILSPTAAKSFSIVVIIWDKFRMSQAMSLRASSVVR